MKRVIMLEGPDGAGKSTLANFLANNHGYKYIHNGLYPDMAAADLMALYLRQILDASTPIVIDRSYLSEWIYGRVMRGHSRFGQHQVVAADECCDLIDVRRVVCLPSWPIVRKNWFEKRKDKFDPINRRGDYVDAEHRLESIYRLYYQHGFVSGARLYNYLKQKPEDVCE